MTHHVVELEIQCLEALQYNYPQLKQCNGELLFVAEDNSRSLTTTAWQFDSRTIELLKQSGLKTALLEMLDGLVAERKQHRIRPNMGGRLTIKEGGCQLEWLTPDEIALTLTHCA